ncbi:rab9 effector protein with kelch motifs isoform X3 [Chiloscyllium plagiosum]|uniref:rab9 effector protein with kelch motifs isoform X3 n=1 Tax=Chiloscyllium plagiosum TaxID=36176 RepID=UPI001CB888BF|nr:rab9 effector protein with kelch motifs isoform X3 [Chiloscyllium plagiosum]
MRFQVKSPTSESDDCRCWRSEWRARCWKSTAGQAASEGQENRRSGHIHQGFLDTRSNSTAAEARISQKAMGLLTVLEPGERPQIATWYTLVPRGECPDVRVGHTLTFVPDTSEEGKVIIVGGANPNGSFSDAHVLDLGRLEWDVPEWKGLLPRYEHSSFISASKPGDLWLFGGADECSNRNCVQVLNFETGLWRSPTINGTPPTPRTCHGSTAAIGDCLYVFGGGDKGAEPVQDTQLYMFDKATLSWSQQSTEGNPPAPRHGHVMIAVGSKLFIHGGLSGDTFFNDMHVIDTETSCWTLLEFGPLLPAGRLDHAMSVIPWKIRKENEASIPAEKNSDEQSPKGNTCEKSSQQSKADENLVPRNCSIVQNQTMNIVHLCLVFGGMDTQGEIYNDCFVTLVDGY